MNMSELIKKSVEELAELAQRLREEARVVRMDVRTQTYTRVHEARVAKKDLARVLTAIGQKRTITRS